MAKETQTENNEQVKATEPQAPVSSFTEKYCETHVITVTPESGLAEVAKLMRENHIGDVVVCDAESIPIGIITDRDIVVGTLGQATSAETLTVQDIMTRGIATARDNSSVDEIVKIMREEGVGRLPLVSEHGTLTGIVTAKKVIQWLSDQLAQLVNAAEKQQANEQELRH